MNDISVSTFNDLLTAEKNNPNVDFINVCTPVEYRDHHIIGVRNVPLDALHSHVTEFKNKETIYVHCRSGNRSQKAISKLKELGVSATLINIKGGLIEWESAGFKTDRLTQVKLPIMQQVLLAAGTLVLISSLGSLLISPLFTLVSVVVGIGLSVAGATGWCGMALVLNRMPWNK